MRCWDYIIYHNYYGRILPLHSSILPFHSSILPFHSSILLLNSSILLFNSSALPFYSSILPFYSSILLFHDGRLLKLCDFGTARKLQHTLTNAVGTVLYMAPEVIKSQSAPTPTCSLLSVKYCGFELPPPPPPPSSPSLLPLPPPSSLQAPTTLQAVMCTVSVSSCGR